MRPMRRREFLTLGAVSGGAALLGGWGRWRSAAGARVAQLAVPTVDRFVLTNAVDNVYDVFARAGQIGKLTVQRTGLFAKPPVLSEHGLAFRLESFVGDERKEILLDFALTDSTLINNYQAMGINPANADALILSHGHLDHYGALPARAAAVPEWRNRGITLYAGGEDTFCHRWQVSPDGQRSDFGQLDRGSLEAQGLKIVLLKDPDVIAGHAITSGQIPRRTDFEKGIAAARLEAGGPGSSCGVSDLHFPTGTLQVEAQTGELFQDIFWGEHATAYNVRDRGLVVISSCGHAGIINSIRQLQTVTGIDKIHAVVGGFHLAPAPDEIVTKTVAALKDINPDYILPMHCTGLNTIMSIQREMPDKLVLPSSGTRVVFGA